MTQALLIVAWPNENEVLTSFRFATGYDLPGEYKGPANLTQISSKVTETGFEIIYRCQGCFSWDHEGATGGVQSSAGFFVLGRASATTTPSNPSCPSKITMNQHESFGQFGAPLETVVKDSYDTWAKLATKSVTGDCGTTGPGEPTPDPVASCRPEMINQTFDYVIIGGGAGGIPMADRLSEKGHSVLLLEKGPASLGMWGGNMKPLWLDKTDLTRFDVPGLCNQIWVDSAGIACKDTDQMAGCVLGGGTAVNAGLWWKVILNLVGRPDQVLTKNRPTLRTGMRISPPDGAIPISELPLRKSSSVSLGRLSLLSMAWFIYRKELMF